MLDDDELAFQLARYLKQGREDDQDRPVLFAGSDCCVKCLDDLDADQEPVKVTQDEKCGPIWRGQRADCLDGGQWVGCADGCIRALVSSDHRQPAINVPGGQGPPLLAAQSGNFDNRIVVLERLNPDACEAARTSSDKRSASVINGLLVGIDERRVSGNDEQKGLSARLLELLIGRLVLIELSGQLLVVREPRACSTNRLASRHSPPVKPRVSTLV